MSEDFEPLEAIPVELRTLPTGDVISGLPYEAPWLSGLGMGLINITALRYTSEGTIECEVGDERGVPYRNGGGTIWVAIDKFPNEWPQ